jgi:hypothetical protein
MLMYRINKHMSEGGDGQNVDEPELPITETRPYYFVEYFVYMGWYYKRVLATIWYGMNTDEQLSQPVSHPEELVDELECVPWAFVQI